jgi:hypothetical protein
MWLFYIAVPLIVAGIIAAFAGGGIFSIVLIPLGIIALITGAITAGGARAGGARSASTRAPQGTGESGSALPHEFSHGSGRAATTPEALANARREAQ